MLKKTFRLRLNTLHLVPILCFCFLLPKLYHLQVIKREHYVKKAADQHYSKKRISPTRGKILDSAGNELAGSRMIHVPYVNSKLVLSAKDEENEGEALERVRSLTRDLVQAIGCEYDPVYKALTARSGVKKVPLDLTEAQRDTFTRVFRKYTPAIPPHALWFEEQTRRCYYRGELAAHVIGFTVTDVTGDNKGVSGVERTCDSELHGETVTFSARRNAMQHAMEPAPDTLLQSTYGHTVVLTINAAIQEAAEKALMECVLKNKADAGIAVAYSVKTGEVLAMANVPTFDVSRYRMYGAEAHRNRVITDAIEPGSVMKIFTFASLFEQGKARPDDIIDCGNGNYAIGGRVIKDVHAIGSASIRKVFEQSSNVGTIKAAQRLTASRFRRHLNQFGFGEKTGIDLPGEATGLLRPISRWSGLSMSSIPMGYELQVTGIQVVAACGAFGNQGIYMQPHVVKEVRDVQGKLVRQIKPQPLRRVASPTTSRHMLEMMEQVVTTGTGKPAQVPGYRVGGKTGTTKKLNPETGKYTLNHYIASFCGIAPMSDPEICVYVYIDDPKGESYYGGSVAAPVFQAITAAAMKVLQIPPDMDTGSQTVGTTTSRSIVMNHIRATLENRIPQTYLSRTVARDRISTSTMPDLEGLTMKEVEEELVGRGIAFRFSGSGVVVEQTPRAYETLEGDVVAQLSFGPESYLLQRVAEAARVAGAAADPFATDPAEEQALADARSARPDAGDPQDGEGVLLFSGKKGGVPLPLEESEESVKPGDLPPPAVPLKTHSFSGGIQQVPEADPQVRKPLSPTGGKEHWAAFEQELEQQKKSSPARSNR